jgi:two-component system, LytTR family, response regulator
MLKAIIIDDEKDAVDFIRSILGEYCPNVDVVDTANSAKSGKISIEEHKPDLVFLDVEMPNGNGFDMLESITQIGFEVIFVTAYNHYAIKAIKYSAADYLLKPIDVDELISAVENIEKNAENKTEIPDYRVLLENLKTTTPTKLAIPTGKGIEYVCTSNILRIEADRSYTTVILLDKKEILVSKSLVEYHELLQDSNFFRPHHSHLINLEHVKLYSKRSGGYIEMIDGSEISLAKSKKTLFIERMKKHAINLGT